MNFPAPTNSNGPFTAPAVTTPGMNRATQGSLASKESASMGYYVVSSRGASIAPEALDVLEKLDDTVYAALSGDAAALDALPHRWQRALQSVDAELVADSQREYVRQAKSAWQKANRDPLQQLPKSFAALEVLEALDAVA